MGLTLSDESKSNSHLLNSPSRLNIGIGKSPHKSAGFKMPKGAESIDEHVKRKIYGDNKITKGEIESVSPIKETAGYTAKISPSKRLVKKITFDASSTESDETDHNVEESLKRKDTDIQQSDVPCKVLKLDEEKSEMHVSNENVDASLSPVKDESFSLRLSPSQRMDDDTCPDESPEKLDAVGFKLDIPEFSDLPNNEINSLCIPSEKADLSNGIDFKGDKSPSLSDKNSDDKVWAEDSAIIENATDESNKRDKCETPNNIGSLENGLHSSKKTKKDMHASTPANDDSPSSTGSDPVSVSIIDKCTPAMDTSVDTTPNLPIYS